MANSNTSLNGYEFGREPKTQAPFWGTGGDGGEIDDTVITGDKTWSSVKIHNELIKKADKTDTYTKSEVDDLISGATPVPTDSYTKAETDELLESYAKVTSVYSKSQTYTKAEVDALIPDTTGLATKTEVNTALASKADADSVYTKSQTDSLIDGCAKATAVYTKSETYTKAEVNSLIQGGGTPVDAYTKAQTDALLDAKADKTELDSYAKVTSVYTKSQTYTKAEVDSLISQAGGVENLAVEIFDVNDVDISGFDITCETGLSITINNNSYTHPINTYLKCSSPRIYGTVSEELILSGLKQVQWSPIMIEDSIVLLGLVGYTQTTVNDVTTKTGKVALVYNSDKITSINLRSITLDQVADGYVIDNASSAYKTYSSNKIDNLLSNKANSDNVYTKSEVDNLISQAGGGTEIDDTTTSSSKVWSSSKVSTELATKSGVSTAACSRARTFTSTNYGLTEAPVDGDDFSAFVQLNINGSSNVVNKFYTVPYNGVTTTPTNSEVAAGPQPYRWLEIPVTVGTTLTTIKVCLINFNYANSKYQPYMFVLYDSSVITSLSQTHNETQMTKIETGGSGGGSLQTLAVTTTSGGTYNDILGAVATAIKGLNLSQAQLDTLVIHTEYGGDYRLSEDLVVSGSYFYIRIYQIDRTSLSSGSSKGYSQLFVSASSSTNTDDNATYNTLYPTGSSGNITGYRTAIDPTTDNWYCGNITLYYFS